MAEIRGTNYASRNKDVLVITLGSEDDSFDLKILPPTVDINKGLVEVAGWLADAADGTIDYDSFDMDECLALVANAMSNNTDMRRITCDYLNGIGFDMSDIGDFLGLYVFFVTELMKGKN